METVTLYSHVGADGFLHLKVPDALINTDCKIILQSIDSKESLGWNSDFLKKTYGTWEGEFVRDQPTEYEQREEWP